jgi:hypothetical protein
MFSEHLINDHVNSWGSDVLLPNAPYWPG